MVFDVCFFFCKWWFSIFFMEEHHSAFYFLGFYKPNFWQVHGFHGQAGWLGDGMLGFKS